MRFIWMGRRAPVCLALLVFGAGLAQAASPDPTDNGDSSPAAAAAPANDNAPGAGPITPTTAYQAWTTPEGVHMLYVAPSVSPHLDVQRCDDGRLLSAESRPAGCRAR